MKVYIVTRGEWDSFTHDAIFSTREKAQAYITECQAKCKHLYAWEQTNDDIEEWDIDATDGCHD